MAIAPAVKYLVFVGFVAVVSAASQHDVEARPIEPRRPAAAAAGAAGAGAPHRATTLAKARKKGRRPGAAPASKADTGAETSGEDEAPAAAAAASSEAGDAAAPEDEAPVAARKKKAKAPSASDDGAAGGGDDDAGRPSAKGVEAVASARAADESGDAARSPAAPPALEFGVGAKALFRQLAWTADAAGAGCSPCLGPYSLAPGPETGAWFEFFPAAFGTTGFAANVGLFGRFDYGFGVATTLANGTDVATKYRDFLAGLKVRVPLGMMIPNLSVAYGQQTFEIAPANASRDLPKVGYAFVRPALGTRVAFTPTVALDVAAAYLMVLDPGSGAGYIKSEGFFPDATSLGFDVSASVALRLSGALGARAGVELRQYAITMNDRTAPTVGGAVDRYVTAWAGIEVVLDGQGGAGRDDDEAPARPAKRRRRQAAPEPDTAESSSSDDPGSADE